MSKYRQFLSCISATRSHGISAVCHSCIHNCICGIRTQRPFSFPLSRQSSYWPVNPLCRRIQPHPATDETSYSAPVEASGAANTHNFRRSYRLHFHQCIGARPFHTTLVGMDPSYYNRGYWQCRPLGHLRGRRSPAQMRRDKCGTETYMDSRLEHRTHNHSVFAAINRGLLKPPL